MPTIGLTESTQRHRREKPTTSFYYNRRAKNRINQKRKDRRRQWRFFKRMCLWERANKAVKELLKKSNLNKRKCLKRHHFNKAMFYARCWFRNTLMERKQDFQRQCVAIASQKKRLYQRNQVQKQDAKHWKLKHGRHLKIATLNVRGCNHLTNRN